MAMTIGELTGYIDLEDRGFAAELGRAENSLTRLQSTTTSKTASIESTVVKSFHEVEQAIKDGLDPDEAIADLDRLEAELDASLREMLDEADAFAAELEREIDEAFASLDDDAKEAGKKAGEDLAEGLKDGVKDAPDEARRRGREAGKGFGDGVEDGAGGRGGSGRMASIGQTLMGGLRAGAVGVAAAAGAAIGQALAGAIEKALEREDLFAELSVKVGAFGKDAERLGEIAGDAYAEGFGESLDEVTEALTRVMQHIDGAGKLGDDALKGMTEQALTTARVMDEDVGAVTRAVSQILRNNLAPSAKDAFDVLVRGQQEGVNKSEDLLDTFNEYSTIFRDLGLSAEDALGLMSQGLQAGARDSDTVADALKELDIRVKDLSAKDALKKLGLDADDMADAFAEGGPKARDALDQILTKLGQVEDPAERARLAVELFGTKGEDMAQSINALNLDKAKSTIGDFKGAVDAASKTLGDTAKADADRWSRSWEETFTALGDVAMRVIRDHFPSPSDLEADWAELSAWFESEVWSTMEDGWTTISDKTTEIWNGLGESLTTKASEIADAVGKVPGEIGQFFSDGWNQLVSDTQAKWEEIRKAATDKADEAVETLQSIPGKIGQFFADGWNQLVSDTSAKWEQVKTAATNKATELVDAVKQLPDKIRAAFSNAGSWLVQAGQDVLQGFINGFRAKVGEATAAVQSVGQQIINAAKAVFDQHSPSQVFAGIGEMVTTGLANGINALSGLATQAINTVTSQVINTAKTTTGTGGGGGRGGTPSTVTHEIGKLTVQGLIKGLQTESGRAVDTVKNLVAQIKDAFSSQPDVVDGLLKFVQVGNDSLLALAKQREELVERLAAAKEMAKQVAGDAREWAEITGLDPAQFAGGADLAQELMNRASAINNFANNIQELARRGLNKAVIQQIIDAGVEKGATFAEMLVGSDGSEIKALNKAQAQVEKASKKLGKVSADAMYDTGKKAGEGYLKGLQDSLKKLDKEMEKIVKALVAAIKKQLKIKSPSQVFAEIGQYTMEGLSVGMESMLGNVVGSAQAVISSAVAAAKTTAAAVTGGKVAGGGGGMLSPVSVHESQIAPLGSNGATGAPSSGVTVNIEHATVREEADFGRIGAEVGFRILAPGLT